MWGVQLAGNHGQKLPHHALKLSLGDMQATLSLSPFLVQKLNRLGSDLYGTNGQQNIPKTTADFIERLRDIMACETTLPARHCYAQQRCSVERRLMIVPQVHGSGVMTSHLLTLEL